MRFLIVIALVGCGNSREKQCQQVLDQYLAEAPANIDKATATAPREQAAELRAQGEKEVAAMREKFVGACKAAENFDPACFDRTKKIDGCKKIRREIEDKVYR